MSREKLIKRSLQFLLVVAALIPACTTIKDNSPIQKVQSTSTPPTSPPSSGILAETLVANPEYMKDCGTTHSFLDKGQIGYRGVMPGQSTNDDVRTLLGDPEQQNQVGKVEEWVYNGFNVYSEADVVTSIDVYDDAQSMVDLQTLIVNYGCPDLIFAIDTSLDQASGNYSLTRFIYLSDGVEFAIPNFPVSISDVPRSIEFFTPRTVQNYLEQSNYMNFTSKEGAPVSWNEAVK